MTSGRMAGKVCLVTGADSGIGRAMSAALAGYGATVILACRNEEKGVHALREIVEGTGNSQTGLAVIDVSIGRSIVRGVEAIEEKFGHIDVLINNAGVLLFKKEMTDEGMERTIATNYLGPFLLTRSILRMNDPKKPCRIVNVVSEGAREGMFDLDGLAGMKRYDGIRAYSFSKQALIYFTFELAMRLKDTNSTVNCFYPGLVRTNLGKPEAGFFKLTFNLMSKLLESKFVPMEEGIRLGLFLACSEGAGKLSGCYLKQEDGRTIGKRKYDRNTAAVLWKKTEDLLGLSEL